ncbi:hypothetical protein AB0F49_28690 [Micromonospora ureilytica]|uniref:hypothetical protein n=1 Tax=Micromonospora ureilytica TaxID=709868 RepID=UPI0033C04FA2
MGAAVLTVALLFAQMIIAPEQSLISTFRTIAQNNLSDLTALIVTSGLGLGFYHFFVREEQELLDIGVVDPQTARLRHAQAVETASFWYAEGQVGRWVRDNVFPAFAKRAQEGMQIHDVLLALVDPRSDDICSIHSVRRMNHLARREQRWDVSRVQAEICATILASIIYCSDFDRLRVRLFVRSGSLPFRVDICTDFLFLTQDDALAPVIAVKAGSKHYNSMLAYFQEFDRNEPQALELNIQRAASALRKQGGSKSLKAEQYLQIVKEAGFDFPALVDPKFCTLVRTCSPALRGRLI